MKNDKTKPPSTIIFALIIGLTLLSPTTVIPPVSAQTQTAHYGLPSIKLPTDVSNQVIQMQQHLSEQIHLHPTWIGLFSGNSHGVTIQYLGPADKNPYYIGNIPGSGPRLHLSPTNNPQAQAGPASYGSSSYNTAYEIQQNFHNISSSNSNVDFLQVLNALNVGSTHWMQNGFTDDVNNLSGSGVGYYTIFDSYPTNGGSEDTGFPVVDSMTVNSATDLIVQNDYANNDGTYTMYSTDNANSNYNGLIVGYSDSGAYMNLGYVQNSGNLYDSGSMSEEESKTSSTWSWSTQTYYLAYWDCSGCTEITTSNNPWTTGQKGGVSFSESNSPNASDSMTY